MKNVLFVLIASVFFITACDAKKISQSETIGASNSNAASFSNASSNTFQSDGSGGGGRPEQSETVQKASLDQPSDAQSSPVAVERKIIRNADLTLESGEPEETQRKIAAIAESRQGFVVETSRRSSEYKVAPRDVINMTVRVPAAKFDEAIGEIRAAATRVVTETVKGEDVTEEFIDVEARLKAQRALEAQFLEIMKRAVTVEDALNVQRQLADVRGEIEKIEGRKRFLENQTAFSTIKIQIQTPAALSANPTGFFYELKEALASGFGAALAFTLFLVKALIALLPFLLFIVLPIYLILRYFLRKRARGKTGEKIFEEDLGSE